MHPKKLIATALTAALVFTLFAMPVSAHHGHHNDHHGHHNSTEYSPAPENDYPVYTVDGCTEYGRHSHDRHDSCGYDHKHGYCDGSCETMYRKDGCDHEARYGVWRHHGW